MGLPVLCKNLRHWGWSWVAWKAQLQQGQRVMEAGCGLSTTLLRYAVSRGCNVWGVDCEFLPRSGEVPRAHLRYGDLTNLHRFKTGLFDCVVSVSVLEHILPERRLFFFSEVVRVLKCGGKLVMTACAEQWPTGLGIKDQLPPIALEDILSGFGQLELVWAGPDTTMPNPQDEPDVFWVCLERKHKMYTEYGAVYTKR